MRRRHLAALVVLALAVAGIAAGCGGGKKDAAATTVAVSGTGTTTAVATSSSDLLDGQAKPSLYNDASLFALHEDDLPTGWVIDGGNTRSVTNDDTAKGRGDAYKRQLESWGRIAGYATGWLPGPDLTGKEIRQIQSSASTFETVGGAEDAFAQGLKEVAASKQVTEVDRELHLGDEARMWKAVVKTSTGSTLTIYELAWRSGRVLATLAVTGDETTATPESALDYAKRQQNRIAVQEKAAAKE